MSSTLPVTREVKLVAVGEGASSVTIPKIFLRPLEWIRGETWVEVRLNNDKTVTLKAVPSKKPSPPPPELPLLTS